MPFPNLGAVSHVTPHFKTDPVGVRIIDVVVFCFGLYVLLEFSRVACRIKQTESVQRSNVRFNLFHGVPAIIQDRQPMDD
jgi:hypothetical protein